MVLHDLSLAARYSDHLVAMKDGTLLTGGPPAQTMTTGMLLDGFGLRAHVFNDPEDDRPAGPAAPRSAFPPILGSRAPRSGSFACSKHFHRLCEGVVHVCC